MDGWLIIPACMFSGVRAGGATTQGTPGSYSGVPAPHLGFKEALGTLDPLGGDVNLREAGQHVQPAVLLQLPSSGLAKDQEELQREREYM